MMIRQNTRAIREIRHALLRKRVMLSCRFTDAHTTLLSIDRRQLATKPTYAKKNWVHKSDKKVLRKIIGEIDKHDKAIVRQREGVKQGDGSETSATWKTLRDAMSRYSSRLIAQHCKTGDTTNAQRIVSDLQSHGYELDDRIIASLMQAYCHSGNVDEAHNALKDLQRCGYRIRSDLVLLPLITRLCGDGNISTAISLLKAISKYPEIKISNGVAFPIFKYFRKNGDFASMNEFYKDLCDLYPKHALTADKCFFAAQCIGLNEEETEAKLLSELQSSPAEGQPAYAEIFRAYGSVNKVRQAEVLFAKLKENTDESQHCSEWYEAMVEVLCDRGNPKRGEEVLKTASRLYSRSILAAPAVKVAIAYARQGLPDNAYSVLTAYQGKDGDVNAYALRVLTKAYLKEGNYRIGDTIAKLFIEENDIDPDPETLVELVRGYLKGGFTEKATELAAACLQRLISGQSKILPPTMYAVSTAMAAANRKDVLSEIQEKIINPKDVSLNIAFNNGLLAGHAHLSQWDDLIALSKQMLQDSNLHNLTTIQLSIQAYLKAGKFSEAEALLQGLLTSTSPYHKPTQEICAMFVKSYAEAKMPDKLHTTREMMKDLSIPLDNVSTAIFVDAYSHLNDFEAVNDVLADYNKLRMMPDIPLLRSIIAAQARIGNFDVVEKVLNEYLQGAKDNTQAYNAVISAYCMVQQIEKALEYLDAMLAKKAQPTAATFAPLIRWFVDRKDWETAEKMLEKMVEVGVPVNQNLFHEVLRGCAVAGDFGEAESLLEQMRELGIATSDRTYAFVIQAYFNAQKPLEAIQVFRRQLQMNISASRWTYDTLIKEYSKLGLLDKAVEVLKYAGEHQVMVSQDVLKSLAKEFITRRQYKELSQMLDLPGLKSFRLSKEMCDTLLERVALSSSDVADIDETAKQVQRMTNTSLFVIQQKVCLILLGARETGGAETWIMSRLLPCLDSTNKRQISRTSMIFNHIMKQYIKAKRVDDAERVLKKMESLSLEPEPGIKKEITEWTSLYSTES